MKGGGSIATGYVKVYAHEIDERPVEGALVRIYRTEDNLQYLEQEFYTDGNGMTPYIALEAPDQSLSLHPHHTKQPYATYDIELSKDGYDIEERRSIQIFETVSSTLDMEMRQNAGVTQRRIVQVTPHRLYDQGEYYA